MVQGSASAKAGNRVKEDAKFTKAPPTEEARENELRWKRVVANDLENIPFAFIIFTINRIIMLEEDARLTMCVLIPLYTFFRIMHTIFFAI